MYTSPPAITPEITVYRYSPPILTAYLQRKVARLSESSLQEGSKTVTRNLAKDGLMEDGKEELLKRKYIPSLAALCQGSKLTVTCVVGRTRAACDLISQYLPKDVYNALKATYEYVLIITHSPLFP